MTTISIQAGGSRYDALVGRDLLKDCGAAIASRLRGPRCALVADENTARLFATGVTGSLQAAGFIATLIKIPPGEAAKSLEQLGAVCDQMTATGLDRSSFVVALGGGVVGDLAGFAAAVYHRGIPYVQIPTTLLAQVDSSIGGKTAVNTAAGKNLLGAVHQPALVIADVETLKSLPAREMNQGFAEIIKHAVIADASLFEKVAQVSSSRAAEDASWKLALHDLVSHNIQIKAAVVAEDARDVSGQRAILNFGHTVGHAIERAGEFGRFLHGEAISLGIVASCEISVRKVGLPEADRAKVATALKAVDLPTRLPPDVSREEIFTALQADKKFERGEVRFVVTPRLGSAYLSSDVTMHDIETALGQL